MSERKNIDRLFQEKFKDFEVNPPKETWANIEAKLDGKKKRRLIPFWWKLSGVAAVFLLGFLISKSIYNQELKTEKTVVNENNSVKKEHINKNNVEIKTENPVVNETNSNKTKQTSTKNNTSNIGSDGVVTNSNEVKSNTISEESKTEKANYSSKSAVAERKSADHRSLKNKSNSENNKTSVAETVFEKSQSQLAQNKNNKNKLTAQKDPSNGEQSKQIAQTDSNEKNNNKPQSISDKAPINLDDLKGNINSKIATKEIEKKVNDTAQKNSVANNVLEELLNEKESKLKQESKRNRWQLTSNVAPIFLGSISNGSPIDSTLTKNSKSYNTNVGFGLGVSYAVNKTMSLVS